MTKTALDDHVEYQIDGQASASWHEIVNHFEDANIYQTYAYGAVRWGKDNLSHLVMRRQGQVLAAVQLRIIRIPLLNAGVAYARWGPILRKKGEATNPNLAYMMLERMRLEYCTRRRLVLRIVPNVFPNRVSDGPLNEALKIQGWHTESTIPTHRTHFVDLSPDVETIRRRLKQKWRNQLNVAERNGLQLEIFDSATAYSEFVRIYLEMRDRKGFDSAVDVHEFGRIQEALDAEDKMTIFLAKKDGSVVGALICSLMGDTAIYLLGATDPAGRNLKASYFLQWQVILWLKSRNARWYDLGGIDPDANPGGYHFKSGFGGTDATQHPPVCTHDGLLGWAVWRGMSLLCRRRSGGEAGN